MIQALTTKILIDYVTNNICIITSWNTKLSINITRNYVTLLIADNKTKSTLASLNEEMSDKLPVPQSVFMVQY